MNYLILFLFLLKCNLAAANIIWPGLFISEAIWSSTLTIIVSLIIEALLFYIYIQPKITLNKAIFMSFVGNIASTFVGVFLTVFFGTTTWHFIMDPILGGTFSRINIFATYILMYLGSVVIEFYTIKAAFFYDWKQIGHIVLIANLITYIVAAISLHTGHGSFDL